MGKRGLLDTSFTVLSNTDTSGEEYIMTVTEPQYISITVVPAVWAKNFFIEVYLNEDPIFKSIKMFYTPWIQIYISEEDFQNLLNLE